MAASATFDAAGWPTATVTEDGDVLTAVIEGIDGLEAARSANADERRRGIGSLDPPTVSTQGGPVELVALAGEAVSSALQSTAGPGEDLLVRYRVAVSVNAALRELGVDA